MVQVQTGRDIFMVQQGLKVGWSMGLLFGRGVKKRHRRLLLLRLRLTAIRCIAMVRIRNISISYRTRRRLAAFLLRIWEMFLE